MIVRLIRWIVVHACLTLSVQVHGLEISADWPAVGVLYESNGARTGCGVGLVAPAWGITAAHCVLTKDESGVSQTKVNLGAFFFDYGWVEVDRVIVRDGFKDGVNPPNSAPPKNDIALVRFTTPITTVEPLKLSSGSSNTDAWMVSGWRDTPSSIKANRSRNFQKVADPMTLSDCMKTHQTGIVCWQGTSTQRAAEPADSGAPIVVRDTNNASSLVGVLVFGSGGLTNPQPRDESWATDVGAHSAWIDGYIGSQQRESAADIFRPTIESVGNLLVLKWPELPPKKANTRITLRSLDLADTRCKLVIQAKSDTKSSYNRCSLEGTNTARHCVLDYLPHIVRIEDGAGRCDLEYAQWGVVGRPAD